MGTGRTDHLELVARGLEKLNSSIRRSSLDPSALPLPCRQMTNRLGACDLPNESLHFRGSATEEESPSVAVMRNSAQARENRRNARGRLIALSEFRRWAMAKFGDLDAMWAALDPLGGDAVSMAEFVGVLKHHGYPMGELGVKTLWFFLDSNENGFLQHEEMISELADIVGSRTSSPQRPRTREEPEEAVMDPVEAAAVRADRERRRLSKAAALAEERSEEPGQAGSTSIDKARAQILDRLRVQDPLVCQLLEFMYSAFRTLRLAFRHMDINGNGLLSKQEFKDSLKTMRSNTGQRPVEIHICDLFARLDTKGTGAATLDEVAALPESADAMLERLGRFLRDHANCDDVREDMREKLRQILKLSDGTSPVSESEFRNLLTRLRYPDWHAGNLFARLDKDGSGTLTIGEFTAFLEKEIPQRRVEAREVVALGTEARRKKVEGIHMNVVESPKLAHCGRGRTAIRWHDTGAGDNDLLATNWHTDVQGLAVHLDRPDYLEQVRTGLDGLRSRNRSLGLRPVSELHLNGRLVLSGGCEPLRDLSSKSLGLESFDCDATRSHMDAV